MDELELSPFSLTYLYQSIQFNWYIYISHFHGNTYVLTTLFLPDGPTNLTPTSIDCMCSYLVDSANHCEGSWVGNVLQANTNTSINCSLGTRLFHYGSFTKPV